MTSQTASETRSNGNALADFNDAMNALGPGQAAIAADTMRRWLAVHERGGSLQIVQGYDGNTGSEEGAEGTGFECRADLSTESEGAREPMSAAVGSVPSSLEDATQKYRDNPAPAPGAEGEGGGLGAVVGMAPAPPSLEAFSQTLRPYQAAVVEDASIFIEECWSDTPPPLLRTIYSAPTGTGKGSVQLAILQGLRAQGIDAWILTPSLEVLRGFLERCGATDLDVSGERLAEMGESIFCTTPVRARNRIEDGTRGTPEIVIYDEVHHAISTNDVSGTLFAVAPDAIWLGFTATPFRASPKATARLLADWGEPVEVMSIPTAIEGGFMALPSFRVVPLVDDDVVKVVNGEFQAKSMNKAYKSRIEELAALVADCVEIETCVGCAQDCGCDTSDFNSPHPIYAHSPCICNTALPTCVTVPSSDVASLLVESLDRAGVVALWVHAKTKAADRAKAYSECKSGTAVLVSIKVLNEGVDFPWLDRLIDARPTVSPVAWLQTIGRIMRPGRVKEYICTNRNLERHAYLMQGAIPRATFVEAQEAFEAPSKRSGMRQIGLEAMARFKAIPLPLDGGGSGAMYCVHSIDEDSGVKTEYVTILDPCARSPFFAKRAIQPLMPGEKKRPKSAYGKFSVCTPPTDFVGYATTPASGKLSEKMEQWWSRDARKYGLSDRNMVKLTRKCFQALPALANTKRNIRGEGA